MHKGCLNVNECYCIFVFQASRLDSEVTKLRAQLERGEAVRQNLEFELAKSRKGNSFEKKSMADRENLITEVNENMKRRQHPCIFQIQYRSTFREPLPDKSH